MSINEKFEDYCYDLFNCLWLEYGLIDSLLPRKNNIKECEEAHVDESVVHAVKVRQAIFHHEYKVLFTDHYEEFEDCTADSYMFLSHYFPHKNIPCEMVSDQILATFAFVAEMCQFCYSKQNPTFIFDSYLICAMYVESQFLDKFYDEGGFWALHRVAQSYELAFKFLTEFSTTFDTAYGKNYISYPVHKTMGAMNSFQRFLLKTKSFEANFTTEWVFHCLQDKEVPPEDSEDRNPSFEKLEDFLENLKNTCDPLASKVNRYDAVCRYAIESQIDPVRFWEVFSNNPLSIHVHDFNDLQVLLQSPTNPLSNQWAKENCGEEMLEVPLPSTKNRNGHVFVNIESHEESLNNDLSKSVFNSTLPGVSETTLKIPSENLVKEPSKDFREILETNQETQISTSPSKNHRTDNIQSFNEELVNDLQDKFKYLDSSEIVSAVLKCYHAALDLKNNKLSNRSLDNYQQSFFENEFSNTILSSLGASKNEFGKESFPNIQNSKQKSAVRAVNEPPVTSNSLEKKNQIKAGLSTIDPSSLHDIETSTINNNKPPHFPRASEEKQDQIMAQLSELDMSFFSPHAINTSSNFAQNSSPVQKRNSEEKQKSNIRSSKSNLSPAKMLLATPSTRIADGNKGGKDLVEVKKLENYELKSCTEVFHQNHSPNTTKVLETTHATAVKEGKDQGREESMESLNNPSTSNTLKEDKEVVEVDNHTRHPTETELPNTRNTKSKKKKKSKKKNREGSRQDRLEQSGEREENLKDILRMFLVLGNKSGLEFIKSTPHSKKT